LKLDGPYKGNAFAAGPASIIENDFHLQTTGSGHANNSPCIDAGDDALVPSGITGDRDGNTRIVGTVDMGAYEKQ